MSSHKLLVKAIVFACLAALVSAGAMDRGPDSTRGHQWSPVNPEYQQYLAAKALGLVPAATEEGYPLGEIPPSSTGRTPVRARTSAKGIPLRPPMTCARSEA